MHRSRLFAQIGSVFRQRPSSQDTAEDRSRTRYHLAALAGATNLFAKVISIGTSLLTVRLTLRYLGSERYGMWLTISSIVMMLGSADLGMSSGLVNLVADALGKQDQATAKKAAASAFWMLSGIAVLISLAMLIAYPFINPGRLLNVQSPIAIREAGPALLVFFFCFVFNLPLGTVRGVQTGLQKAFVNNLWQILGTVLSLIALLIAIKTGAGLPLLVLGLSGPPIFALVLNAIELFVHSHPELRPALSNFSKEAASRLFRTGLMFFLLQLSITVGMQTDNVVIAQIMGAQSVASYAVPARLFNVVTAFLVMLSGTLWPAYADAFARSDVEWIRKTFWRVAAIGTAITIALALVFLVFGNIILKLWVGPQIQASHGLLAAFGVQCILNAYLQPIGFLLNGIGRFREQVIAAATMAILNLGLSIVLVRHLGIIGAVLGTVISVALVAPALTIVAQRALRSLTSTSPVVEVSPELPQFENGDI